MVEVLVPGRAWPRPLLTTVGLAGLLAAAIVGGSPYGVRERLWHATQSVAAAPAVKPWQEVVSLQGEGRATAAPFSIDKSAVEWRVKWWCEFGHLLVEGSGSHPVVDASCPGTGTGFATGTGTSTLDVTATGRWTLHVQQHLDQSGKRREGM